MKFPNRVVIVTGGANGIGKAAAILFAHEGAKVAIADTDVINGRKTAARIVREGGKARFIETDVSNSHDVNRMVAEVVSAWGRIDVLFNNAGVYARGDVVSFAEEEWNRVIRVNLTGVYLCSKAVIPVMKMGFAGVIINTSSSVGWCAAARGIAAYAASKGGVTLLTKAMANDHLRDHIRVNCICPGPTDTPLIRKSRTREQLKDFVQALPSRKLLKPEEIARAVLFLASDDASGMTGVALPVDMGQSAHF
ncbi:MAG: SDR family oxidoreductase [Spirochaetia bacterium]|jgi:NAD(P)-dependent dehydrogenase (short-subunit alcohol dehydrogenase family)